MSLEFSIRNQKEIADLKKAIKANFTNKLVVDLVVLEFPRWSIYFKDGTSTHSFDFNCVKAGVIHKYLRENFL